MKHPNYRSGNSLLVLPDSVQSPFHASQHTYVPDNKFQRYTMKYDLTSNLRLKIIGNGLASIYARSYNQLFIKTKKKNDVLPLKASLYVTSNKVNYFKLKSIIKFQIILGPNYLDIKNVLLTFLCISVISAFRR